jgi:hypothetical protein
MRAARAASGPSCQERSSARSAGLSAECRVRWRFVASRRALTSRQLDLLRRLASADTAAVESVDAAVVYALRLRGLVSTPKPRSYREATVTPAEYYYLEHGEYPDRGTTTDRTRGAAVASGRPPLDVAAGS